MIIKHIDLKVKLNDSIKHILLYGPNSGQIEETINILLKPKFSKNIIAYDESEILANVNLFLEGASSMSFFENDKLIIINRATDKILDIIVELINKNYNDLAIIIKSGPLEKKSKLRSFFEKNKNTFVIPHYEENQLSLTAFAENFLKKNEIKFSRKIINLIVERSKGNRINLKNELNKIYYYSKNKNSLTLENIYKLTNLAENYNYSEIVDQCLSKNKTKTINIINENISSNEDNIIVLKNFLFKLKRIKKIKENLTKNSNLENIISSFKPPIFWKDKECIKKQLKEFSLIDIKKLIIKTNKLEKEIKINSQISDLILQNFILETVNMISNNA